MDAITIGIIRNKVASLVEEMHYHFYRSGYSTIIRESRDFSCVILDRTGRLIVPPPMFFHAPVYRHLVGRIIEVYGKDNGIEDGDVFVSNHPYEGGLPHVSDMAFVAPVFTEGKIAAFAASIAHKADVGGAVAGSTSANATEMFQEGLLLPPIKIVAAGSAQTDIERIILANSREPALMRGDIHAQIAATEMGAQRISELCERFGARTVTEVFAAILKARPTSCGPRLRGCPPEKQRRKVFSTVMGRRGQARQAGGAHRDQGRHCELRFLQQRSAGEGPVNLRPSMVEACVFYA
jgi:N-methylhydantoinase B